MEDNFKVEDNHSIKEDTKKNELTFGTTEMTTKKIDNKYSIRDIPRFLYAVIEPYYDLLIINKKFRCSFSGTIGQYFSEIALFSLIETQSGEKSGFALGGIYMCYALPPILLMLVTGGAADYFDKRKLMVFADLSRACLALLNLLVLLDIERFRGFLYVILFLSVSCGAFFDPSREGFVPFIVEKEKLTASSAIDALTWMTCTLLGGSLGGLVTATMGYYWNFTLNAVTYLISALFVAQLFRFPELSADELQKQALLMDAKDKEEREKAENEEKLKQQNDELPSVELESIQQEQKSENELESTEQLKDQETESEPLEQQQDVVEDSVDVQMSNLIHTTEEPQEEKKQTKLEYIISAIKELFLGIKYLILNPYALTLVCIKGSFIISFIFMDFLTIKFADGKFKIGDNPSAMLGLSKGLLGISAGLTPVLLERIIKPTVAKMRFIIFLTSLCSSISFFLFFWSPNIAVYMMGIFMFGPSIGVPWVFSTAMVQRTVPKELIGRILVMDYGFVMNLSQLSSIISVSLLIDVGGLNVNQLSLVACIFAGCMSIYYGIWCFVTRKYA